MILIHIEGFSDVRGLGVIGRQTIHYYPSKKYEFSNEEECETFIRMRFANFYKTNVQEELTSYGPFEKGGMKRIS